MCTRDDDVSPYQRRPLRTYEKFLRDQAERARKVNGSETPTGTSTRNSGQEDPDDVEPHS